jgi:threonine aldolase
MEMRWADFRSDTVTVPTPKMREAMFNAQVGDDVLGEDPTILELERLAAEKVGKEAALFCTSGTQGNLVAVLTHTRRGDEVLLEAESHIYYYEVGGISALGGVIPRPITGQAGVISPEALRAAIRPADIHYPNPSLFCLENSHNRGGGAIWTPEQITAVAEVAKEGGLKVHMDGARLFNSAVSQKRDVQEFVAPVDSVMFCLSKGLGAPAGSMLAGSREFINQARKWRKMLGGGMRQAGILAAAGIVAMESMVERLEQDHQRARRIGEELAAIPGLKVNLDGLKTNIVLVQIDPEWGNAKKLLAALKEKGVLASEFGPHKVRFVTHKEVNDLEADILVQSVREIMVNYMGEI